MNMDIQTRAEPLHKGDGARVKLAGLAAPLRRTLVVARELLGVDARERAKHLRLGRGQQRQLEREGQDELPNRHRRQAPASSASSPPRRSRTDRRTLRRIWT